MIWHSSAGIQTFQLKYKEMQQFDTNAENNSISNTQI